MSESKHSPKKEKHWKKSELTCKPLDTFSDIELFLENPPPWRSLCKELTPHSSSVIRNREINKHLIPSILEMPESFCHFDPDADCPNRYDQNKMCKTLVCHDMANGYHDDCFIEGTGNETAYSFYHWGGIDIFCYFSHHLITIPPLGWINIGHAHGVKVIGTVITEYMNGTQFWDKILESETDYKHFADSLVAIAKILKFDGWLLNIENKINKPEMLVEFVDYFHSTLHKELQNPVLVWYDSVTINGSLNWQNGLNEKNRAFFEVCDAFFTNYSWSEEDIKSSQLAAGDRVVDVFVGIDVWGRNFYGGGQFNVHEAVKVVHSYGCSLAIFAPGWTREAITKDKSDVNAILSSENMDVYDMFLLRDRALWCSMWPYLNTRLPCVLPFQTSFCKGQGKKRRLYGEVICPVPWYNLRHMHYQLNSNHGPHGYILSTYENILRASHHGGLFKDNKGIIRYKDTLERPKFDFDSSDKELSASREFGSEPSVSLEKASGRKSVSIDNDIEQKKETLTIKSRILNAIRQVFKRTPKTAESEPGPSSTGKSMVNMSVALSLGRENEKTRYGLACVPEELECIEVYRDDSFIGGSCIKINPSDRTSALHRTIRLLHCDFLCEDSLIAVVVTKVADDCEDQYLNIRMSMKNSVGEDFNVVLIGRSLPAAAGGRLPGAPHNPTGILNLYPLNPATDYQFREMQTYLLLQEPGFYVPVENPHEWVVRYFVLSAPGSRVLQINCRTSKEFGSVLLGHFGLCNMPKTSGSFVTIPNFKSWGVNLL